MNIINKIKSIFGSIEPVEPTPVKLTQEEMVAHINKEYHFTVFEESLVDEIYSKMLDYGSIKVEKESKYKYVVEVTNDEGVVTYEITQSGFKISEIESSEL
jgi:uncharacterized protein with von Willebrand factor type A (vWA) domain